MSCEKLTFETYYEAARVISASINIGRKSNRRNATKHPKRVYKCEHCGKYHLTSQKKKVSKSNHHNYSDPNKSYKPKF
jgi:hypothetical protein